MKALIAVIVVAVLGFILFVGFIFVSFFYVKQVNSSYEQSTVIVEPLPAVPNEGPLSPEEVISDDDYVPAEEVDQVEPPDSVIE